jgi:hypothetical protein
LRVVRAITASDILDQYRALATMPAVATSEIVAKGR